jgi:hypothetical protein
MNRSFWHGLIAAALLSGCTSMKVSTDFLEGEDFTRFETFQFKEADPSIAEVNPIAHRRIVAALKREMTAAGFAETDTEPDLNVTYYGKVNEQVVLETVRMGYDYGYPWRWDPGWGYGFDPWVGPRRPWPNDFSRTTTQTVTYREGTIVIDIWTAAPGELIWRGVISDFIDNDVVLGPEQINRGIERVFKDFPPGRGS